MAWLIIFNTTQPLATPYVLLTAFYIVQIALKEKKLIKNTNRNFKCVVTGLRFIYPGGWRLNLFVCLFRSSEIGEQRKLLIAIPGFHDWAGIKKVGLDVLFNRGI